MQLNMRDSFEGFALVDRDVRRITDYASSEQYFIIVPGLWDDH